MGNYTVNFSNVKELKEAGVDIVVAGSYIINSDNYINSIKELKK